MIVFARTRIFKVCRMSVRCIYLVNPKVFSLCVSQEVYVLCLRGLLLRSDRLQATIRERPLMVFHVIALLFVVARTWLFCLLVLDILAVGHFAQEHSTVNLGIEVFLIIYTDNFIMSRCWVFLCREVVLSSLVWFEDLPWNLACNEVSCSLSLLNMTFFETVTSWANSVLTKT